MVSSLRVLIFGYGFAGAWIHDPLISAVPGLEVTAVVTSNPQRQALARSRHPDVGVFSSPGEALEEAGTDIAVVATPNRHHVELTLAALGADMTVVVDKPLANSAREASLLVAEAERLGKSLAVFHNRRWDGDYLTIRELLEHRRLGSIYSLTSRFDRWVPDPARGWRDEEPHSGGGLLLDLGSHLVDQAIELQGPVESVYCQLMTLVPQRRSEDCVFVSLRHASGSVSHLHASALEGEPSTRFHVSGSEGAYVKQGKDIQEERLLAGDTVVPGEMGREPTESWGRIFRGSESEPIETIPGDWSGFYRELVAHLTEGTPIPVTGEEACEVLRILDAARVSARDGAVISTRLGGTSDARW